MDEWLSPGVACIKYTKHYDGSISSSILVNEVEAEHLRLAEWFMVTDMQSVVGVRANVPL